MLTWTPVIVVGSLGHRAGRHEPGFDGSTEPELDTSGVNCSSDTLMRSRRGAFN